MLIVSMALIVFFITPYVNFYFVKNEVTKKLRAKILQRESPILLTEIISKKYKTICIQQPYMQRDFFEKQTQRKIDNFKIIDDHITVWWFFYENSDSLAIEISRSNFFEMPQKNNSTCRAIEKTIISFSCKKNVCHYTFKDI